MSKQKNNNVDKVIQELLQNKERELLKQYQKALKEIKSEIAKLYEKYGDDLSFGDAVKLNRLSNVENKIKEQLVELQKNTTATIKETIKSIYSETYNITYFNLEKSIGLSLNFGLLPKNAIEQSVLNPLDRIKWTERNNDQINALNKTIREEITQGLIQGKGYAKVAKVISEKTEISYKRAMRIARTEGHRAFSEGTNKTFETAKKAADNMGYKIKKVWVATLDEKTRTNHQKMDGQIADEEGNFTLPSGVKTKGPGQCGIPEEDINCRCKAITQIEGFESKTRKDNVSKKLITNITYQEWLKTKS